MKTRKEFQIWRGQYVWRWDKLVSLGLPVKVKETAESRIPISYPGYVIWIIWGHIRNAITPAWWYDFGLARFHAKTEKCSLKEGYVLQREIENFRGGICESCGGVTKFDDVLCDKCNPF